MSKYAAAAPIPLAMLKLASRVFVELSASCPPNEYRQRPNRTAPDHLESNLNPPQSMTSDFCAIVSLRAYLRVKPSRRRTITFHAVSWEEHWMLRHHSAKTAIQRAQKELHHSEEQFRLLVDGVKDYAIFMLDKAGNVVSWNTGAEQIKGYRAHEILGHHFSCFYTSEDIESEKPERELERAAKDGRYEEE